MAGKKRAKRMRGKNGKFLKMEQPEPKVAVEKPVAGEPGKKVSARERVKKAQLVVLDKLTEIVEGNCKSAAGGNYNNAKFVLDWSGISEIRTPLAPAKKRKSVLSALLKKLREAPKEEESAEKDGGSSAIE
jgi:hypothetical protein